MTGGIFNPPVGPPAVLRRSKFGSAGRLPRVPYADRPSSAVGLKGGDALRKRTSLRIRPKGPELPVPVTGSGCAALQNGTPSETRAQASPQRESLFRIAPTQSPQREEDHLAMWTEPSTRTSVERGLWAEPLNVIRRLTPRPQSQSYWTRIGTAYRNRDGSLNLRFNYLPADLASTTIRVREPRAKADDDAPEAGATP
jgi:hypothetical protein